MNCQTRSSTCHDARIIWAYVEGLDLDPLDHAIGPVERGSGRPAADPKILLTLWIYATVEGVGPARELDRLCRDHIAFQWVAGDVSMMLVDGGLGQHDEIDAVSGPKVGCTASAPVPGPKDPKVDRHEAKLSDSEAVAEWRARMTTDAAEVIYKGRGATAGCVNALARGRSSGR